MLTFTEFSTEACCDFVTIYDGDSTKSPLIASLSGTLAMGTQYNSTQRYMFIRFSSDNTVSGRGFSANYRSTTQGSNTRSNMAVKHRPCQHGARKRTYYNSTNNNTSLAILIVCLLTIGLRPVFRCGQVVWGILFEMYPYLHRRLF